VKIFLVLALLAACHSTYAEPREPDPRCSMIEAALAIDDAVFQRFYRGGECGAPPTGRDGGRLIVDVQGLQLEDADTCPSKRFTLFHERRTRTSSRKILQLAFAPLDDGRMWAFYASYLDPPSHPGNGDGFDDITYYCHLIDGHVAREPHGWRAWVQHDKPASPAAGN